MVQVEATSPAGLMTAAAGWLAEALVQGGGCGQSKFGLPLPHGYCKSAPSNEPVNVVSTAEPPAEPPVPAPATLGLPAIAVPPAAMAPPSEVPPVAVAPLAPPFAAPATPLPCPPEWVSP